MRRSDIIELIKYTTRKSILENQTDKITKYKTKTNEKDTNNNDAKEDENPGKHSSVVEINPLLTSIVQNR